MGRYEQLQQAADAYTSQMCKNCSAMLYCEEKNKKCVERREQENVYVDGAKWADEHPVDVWHEASEMPKEGKWILIQFVEDSYDTLVLCDMDADIYCAWCKMLGVIRWAYINDILPKGGEE